MSDFIHRINPKDVNKLQLEGLVKAGAFDKLDTNRKKLFFSIPKIIQTIKNNHDDKISKQTNLFENLNEKKQPFDFDNNTKDFWDKKELLSEEFSSLGFIFLTTHSMIIEIFLPN